MFGADLPKRMFGAGLPTPPKLPTEGLLFSLILYDTRPPQDGLKAPPAAIIISIFSVARILRSIFT